MASKPNRIFFLLGGGRASTDATAAIALQLRYEEINIPIHFVFVGISALKTALGKSYVLADALQTCGDTCFLAFEEKKPHRRLLSSLRIGKLFATIASSRSLVFIAPRTDKVPLQPIPRLVRLGGGVSAVLKAYQAPFSETMKTWWKKYNPGRTRSYKYPPDYCVFCHPDQASFYQSFVRAPGRALGTFHLYPAWRKYLDEWLRQGEIIDVEGRRHQFDNRPLFVVLGEERIIDKNYLRPSAARDQMVITLEVLSKLAPHSNVIIKPHPGFNYQELHRLVGRFLNENTFISDAHVHLLARRSTAVFSGTASSAFLNFYFERKPVVETTLYDPKINPSGLSKIHVPNLQYAHSKEEIAALVNRLISDPGSVPRPDPSSLVHPLNGTLQSKLWGAPPKKRLI